MSEKVPPRDDYVDAAGNRPAGRRSILPLIVALGLIAAALVVLFVFVIPDDSPGGKGEGANFNWVGIIVIVLLAVFLKKRYDQVKSRDD